MDEVKRLLKEKLFKLQLELESSYTNYDRVNRLRNEITGIKQALYCLGIHLSINFPSEFELTVM